MKIKKFRFFLKESYDNNLKSEVKDCLTDCFQDLILDFFIKSEIIEGLWAFNEFHTKSSLSAKKDRYLSRMLNPPESQEIPSIKIQLKTNKKIFELEELEDFKKEFADSLHNLDSKLRILLGSNFKVDVRKSILWDPGLLEKSYLNIIVVSDYL